MAYDAGASDELMWRRAVDFGPAAKICTSGLKRAPDAILGGGIARVAADALELRTVKSKAAELKDPALRLSLRIAQLRKAKAAALKSAALHLRLKAEAKAKKQRLPG